MNRHGACDIERMTARIALKTARPRDLSGLLMSLQQLPLLQTQLQGLQAHMLQTLATHLHAPHEVVNLLNSAIRPEPSVVLREGGVIADGYDAELDELRALQNNHGEFLLQYEAAEKARTGITTVCMAFTLR